MFFFLLVEGVYHVRKYTFTWSEYSRGNGIPSVITTKTKKSDKADALSHLRAIWSCEFSRVNICT